ncbi:MAG: DUF6067 family protein [Planctomycetota bacterium]|nr:DUF6067 family protein [Planctomycetota bacterium]MDA1137801.1 DUF6067 family protein [Planctomycetota bacterium]
MDGNLLGRSESSFERKERPQLGGKPEGMDPEVPGPWRPVKAAVQGATGVVNIWGREYRFNGQPVPSSILATPIKLSAAEPDHPGRSLLAAPIELRLTAKGKVIEWKTGKLEICERRPSKIVVESENRGSGFLPNAEAVVDFDGMIRVDFELSSDPPGRVVNSWKVCKLNALHHSIFPTFHSSNR